MENREKAVNLFKYIMELHALKYPITMDISKQEWYKFVCNLEEDKENIKINYIDKNSENIEENNFLVEIVKPEFEENPKLPKELENWLEDSWNDYRNNLTIISEKIDKNSEIIEKFEDKKERMEAFEKFKIKHKLWAEKQKVIENTRNLFSDLYLKYIELQRDSETLEFVLGQGLLECENEKKIKHPILLKRVALEFDALNNKIKIVDTDTESEIYTGLLQNIDFINHSVIKNFKNELEENFYHPFEKTETSNFLKSLTHSLHPESQYIEKNEENKTESNRLIIKNAPVFFIRKRTSGVVKSIEEIIKELEEGKEISGPLLNLIGESVSQYSDEKREESISESLASVNGEDKNILLSKEANREQLEIAKKIEDYNAVLVQGPPGTGKTHTIANLIGHFLAHGKNVLVTSHTKKALSVVKEKLNPELQNLCVSILDDNNRDMEQSIDGITEYIATHSSLELLKKSEELKNKRENIIDELNKVRKDLFDIKLKEFEPINIDGEFFNPTQAAKFIFDNTELIDCIPGKMNIDNATLINPNDIEFLYKTNEFISPEEEKELGSAPMPQLEFLIKPEELEELINEYDSNLDENKNILRKLTDKKIELDYKNKNLIIAGKNLSFFYDEENLKSLKNFLKETKIELETFEDEWQAYAILDGKTGGGYKNIWLSFAQKIESAYNYAGDNIGLTLGKQISGILDKTNSTLQTLNSMKEHLLKGKKINSFSFFKPKDWIEIYEKIRIDGHTIDTVNDCETLISFISLSIKREELSRLWYELIEKKNGPAFKSLGSEPELKAINYVTKVKNCIEWYETNYRKMQTLIEKAGLNIEILLSKENLDMNPEELKHMLKDIYLYLPMYIDLLINIHSESNSLNSKYEDSKNCFTVEQLETSSLYKNLFDSLEKKDVKKYSENYKKLEKFYEKETYITERQRILKII
ncbi:MAG: AAA family ATPase, partial [Fusobacterium sp.]|nr:AAA family ATPase [Fusobacterium sp.]